MSHPLHPAGWSIGDAPISRPDGSRSCLASGSNGEELIRVEAPIHLEAWRTATDQARSLGILGRG